MKKDYYEILEINKNASPEIIEKAYKTLVKKYHPDLHSENDKPKYEEKIKLINEAYEVLSNEESRENYNLNLEENKISNQEFNNLYNENINLKNQINNLKNNNYYYNYNKNKNIQNNYKKINQDEYNRIINNATNKAYYDAYIQDLKNRGYKIKYKKNWRDFLALLITIIILCIIAFVLWQIPYVRNYFINLYNENNAFRFLINLINNIFHIF